MYYRMEDVLLDLRFHNCISICSELQPEAARARFALGSNIECFYAKNHRLKA